MGVSRAGFQCTLVQENDEKKNANLKNYKLLLWHDIPSTKVSYQRNTLKRSTATLKLVEFLQPAVLDTCNIKTFQIILVFSES